MKKIQKINGISNILKLNLTNNDINNMSLIAEVFPKAETAILSMNILTEVVEITNKYLMIFV